MIKLAIQLANEKRARRRERNLRNAEQSALGRARSVAHLAVKAYLENRYYRQERTSLCQ